MSSIAVIDGNDKLLFQQLRERMTAADPTRVVAVTIGTKDSFERKEFRLSANMDRASLQKLEDLAGSALAPPSGKLLASALTTWKGCVRPSDFADPEQYAKNLAVLLTTYPTVAVAALADLTRADHVARSNRKFTPTIGDVCAWLDEVARPFRSAHEQAERYLLALDDLERARRHPLFLHEGTI